MHRKGYKIVRMTNVSTVTCPQLLGEYESLRRDHEEVKVKNLNTLDVREGGHFIL